jgi:hypothetical protein
MTAPPMTGDDGFMANLVPFSYQGLPSWQVRTIKDYPKIYLEPDPRFLKDVRDRDRDFNPHARYFCNLRFGFECKSGWERLISRLSSVADELCADLRASGRQPNARITAFIVKEKFGTLRWQGTDNLVAPYRTLFNGFAQAIEQHSKSTCEICGKFGRIRDVKGWHTAICDQDFDRLTNS